MGKITTLAVSHNVWLTRDQRYQLQNGDPVETTGVSTPVWFYKGNTSEPANEVFCRYVIESKGPELNIIHLMDGFQINIPLKHVYGSSTPPNVPSDLWNSLSQEEKDTFYANNPAPPNVSSLKDNKDGGCEWFFFRQYTKIKRKVDDNLMHLLHYIEIKDMQALTSTLC